MKENQAIDTLGALSHQVRLRIIKYLIKQGEKGASAGELAKAVTAAPSKLTFHVSILERAALVSSTRVSRSIVYRIEFSQMGALINYLLKDCCRNDPEVMRCCKPSK